MQGWEQALKTLTQSADDAFIIYNTVWYNFWGMKIRKIFLNFIKLNFIITNVISCEKTSYNYLWFLKTNIYNPSLVRTSCYLENVMLISLNWFPHYSSFLFLLDSKIY